MSIIYKGLNPKHHYGLCILTIKGELITANGKHFQAIQIPTPHGRLIDGGKLKDTLKEYCIDDDEKVAEWYRIMGIDEAIDDNAPTILEAEE